MQRFHVPSHDMQMLQAASKGEWAKVRAGLITVIEINKDDLSGSEAGMTILLFAARDKQWDLVNTICEAYQSVNVNARQKPPAPGSTNPDHAIQYAHVDHNVLWFALNDQRYGTARMLVEKKAVLSTTEGLNAEALQAHQAIRERLAFSLAHPPQKNEEARTVPHRHSPM